VRAPRAKYAVLGSRLPLSGLPLQGVTQDFCDDRNSGIGCPFVPPLTFLLCTPQLSICISPRLSICTPLIFYLYHQLDMCTPQISIRLACLFHIFTQICEPILPNICLSYAKHIDSNNLYSHPANSPTLQNKGPSISVTVGQDVGREGVFITPCASE